jgi:hypothetical protein
MSDTATASRKKPRVFIGLTEISGYYRGVKKGFEEIGVPCTFINLFNYRFAYGGEDKSRLVRWILESSKRKETFWKRINALLRGLLFWQMLFTHDVFIFGFSTSFFKGHRDLPLLKLFGKRILYQFHGSDSRPPYLDGSVMASGKGRTVQDCITRTKVRRATVDRINRYADVIIDIPPTCQFHTQAVVNWLRIGIPCQPPVYPADLPEPRSAELIRREGLRILHCPSYPEAKGSHEIRRVIEALQRRGHALHLVEVVNQPNSVVLKELAHCDIVIDQLYADYGMPGFATEAAWYGKPVLIAGYARDLWERLLPEEWTPPTLYCHPDEFEQALTMLITDHAFRAEIARQARAFVENQWHPKAVAQRYLQVIEGNFPEDWLINPACIRYWEGCCFPESRVRALLGEVLAAGGVEALQLPDKPALAELMQSKAMPSEPPVLLAPSGQRSL